MTRIAAVVAVVLLASTPLAGHGGGLDRNGCHTNRKTGEYHCHGAPSAAPPPGPHRASSDVIVRAAATTTQADLVRAAQVLLRALGYKPSLLGTLDERTLACRSHLSAC